MTEEKTRKELLEEPDPFLVFVSRILEFAKKYQQQIILSVVAVFIVVAVISGVVYFKHQTEDKAALLLAKAMEKYNTIVKKDPNILNPKETPVAAYDEVRNSFRELLDKYGSTGAGKAALLNYADLCYQAKDYENAIKTYEKALDVFGNKGEFKNLILNGLAYSYEAKQDLDNAAKYFNMIVSDKDSAMKDQALFNLGEIYAKLGKKDQEAEAFKRIVAEYPDSMFAKIAKEKIPG